MAKDSRWTVAARRGTRFIWRSSHRHGFQHRSASSPGRNPSSGQRMCVYLLPGILCQTWRIGRALNIHCTSSRNTVEIPSYLQRGRNPRPATFLSPSSSEVARPATTFSACSAKYRSGKRARTQTMDGVT